MKKSLFWAALSLAIAGCSQAPTADDYTGLADLAQANESKTEIKQVALAPEFVNAQLSSTARTVSNGMQRLAEVESATHPQARMPSPVDARRIGMAQKASVDWTGPARPLVEKIAAASHYKLHVIGAAPALPVLVNVSAKAQSLANILRNVGYQVQKSANIVIYPRQKLIEMRYHNA